MIRNLLITLSTILLLNGCASTRDSKPDTGGGKYSINKTKVNKTRVNKMPAPETAYPDSYEQAKVITTASYATAPVPIQRKKTTPASREAVLDLMRQSKLAIEENNYNEAENILKRALRIEPGNAWLWYNMAVISFYQANYHQAIQQALKSNNLESDVKELRNNNYKLIEQSYIELGEPVKAKSVRKKIK